MVYRFEEYKRSDIARGHLNLGGANPSGERIDVTSLYFERAGKPWIGVMGEYHFARDNRENWYRELCKMKAGGVNIVASYFFWIYHEEEEGCFDFTGDLDARYFLEQTKKAGIDVVLRLGPWAHGECRNGGFPDWLVNGDYELRTNDEKYLEKVRIFWEKIYEEVKDYFYEDGGNVVAIQIENELTDNAKHIATLKQMAMEIGFKAPLWTVTGWNSETGAKIPVDEVVPLFGSYAALPWEAGTHELPPSVHYFFTGMRNDTAIGTDLIPKTESDGWILPYERYPYATCETGAGIMPTHHRRPIMKPMDIYAMSLVKLGDGNNLIGYYMYHGGINKIGMHSTFNETRTTGYPNDYPIISYDFQAPLSQYGEIREHYRLLNLLHMFVTDFGDILAPMETCLSEAKPDRNDTTSLRYAMRTDGEKGFVFINHHQKNASISDITNVVIDTGIVVFPYIDVVGDVSFILPFNIPLGAHTLNYATAQLLAKVDNTYFFFEIPGVRPTYEIDGEDYDGITVGINSGFDVDDIRIVTLSMEEALYARKLQGTLYLGEGTDLMEYDDEIVPAEPEKLLNPALLMIEPCDEPFPSTYPEELNLFGCGGEGTEGEAGTEETARALSWYKLSVDSGIGYVSVDVPCDACQIFADGEMIMDQFYFGVPLNIPANLLYEKECYMVCSEMRDDFYREF